MGCLLGRVLFLVLGDFWLPLGGFFVFGVWGGGFLLC